jgi:cell division protein FtsI/penicillin-binding protein 2
LARDPTPPSASVFKLVTAAALIEAGAPLDEPVCYGGGLRRLTLADVLDNPARDRACATLAQAISGSINAVVAKLADRKLDRTTIERFAHAFGFGQALPFDSPTQPSLLDVPEDRLERARAAAGFWHSYMSPLHGAVLAATIANRGEMPRPAMVERVLDAEGHELYLRQAAPTHAAISSATAATLGQMMLGTVTHGTARTAFRDAHGRSYLPGIAVAGKTGSLSSDKPFRAYSWWVGYAPEAAPEIALAALVVNTPEWRIKASQVAREALRYYLITRKEHARKAATPSPVAPSPP